MTDYGLTFAVGLPCHYCGRLLSLHDGACDQEKWYWQGFEMGWDHDHERESEESE